MPLTVMGWPQRQAWSVSGMVSSRLRIPAEADGPRFVCPAVVVIDGLPAVSGVYLGLAGVAVCVFGLGVDVACGVLLGAVVFAHLLGVRFEPCADGVV